jgi:hypothetical protein
MVMQFEVKQAKTVVFLSFLILLTFLAVYLTMLLFNDVSIRGKAAGQSPSSSLSSLSSDFSSTDPLDVEIVYPAKDQTTNIKNNLEISGVSSYNPGYICHVSVIINDVKPYQKTTPIGKNVENDYSTWKYVVNSDYTTIREGDNKITARLLCSDDNGQDMRKWDTVTVVGQAGGGGENNYQNPTKETLAVPIDVESAPAGVSSTTIEIDRNTFMELISNRIGNNTEAIRDSIKDSIVSVYTGIK